MDVRLFFWSSVRLFGGYISFVDWLRMSMYFYKPRFNWINASRGQAVLWGCKFAKPQYRSRWSSSCRLVLLATLLARRKRERTVTLRHNRNPIFFSISIIFLFFSIFFFFLRGWGAEGPDWDICLFVCCFLNFLKCVVRLRRVENTAVARRKPRPEWAPSLKSGSKL